MSLATIRQVLHDSKEHYDRGENAEGNDCANAAQQMLSTGRYGLRVIYSKPNLILQCKHCPFSLKTTDLVDPGRFVALSIATDHADTCADERAAAAQQEELEEGLRRMDRA